jgi:hypothetical protein
METPGSARASRAVFGALAEDSNSNAASILLKHSGEGAEMSTRGRVRSPDKLHRTP